MSTLPTYMRDRWQNRNDTPPGKGVVYWHILMGSYPHVRSTTQRAQKQLAQHQGLHMTPLDWLHMSTLVVGSTDDVTTEQMQDMLADASQSLSQVAPIHIKLGNVLYHPEAIMLGIQPEDDLTPVFDAARSATQRAVGQDGTTTSGAGRWIPHMTVCYSTAQQPAAPLIDALGSSVPTCEVRVDTLTLVVQWGPEREWNWQPVGTVPLAAPDSY